MRTPKHMKSAVDALVAGLTGAALTSCGETPGWRYAGVRQVSVEELTESSPCRTPEHLMKRFRSRCSGALSLGEC